MQQPVCELCIFSRACDWHGSRVHESFELALVLSTVHVWCMYAGKSKDLFGAML